MDFEFAISAWSAYADGMVAQSQWLAWAHGPASLPPVHLADMPQMVEMPAMLRRRVDRLGRLACQVAYWCQPSAIDVPMVFASRYGDAARSSSLLADLVRGEALSPTNFGLSVHNAIAAQYAIARGHTLNTVAVAAGNATVEAALVEATALLADGAREVLVVYYEAPLPDEYAEFADEPACEYAWAWRVCAPGSEACPAGLPRLRLSAGDRGDARPRVTRNLPGGLEVLRFALRHMGVRADGAPRGSLRTGAQWLLICDE